MSNTTVQNQTFRINLETPSFLQENLLEEWGTVLLQNPIDGLIDVETDKAPEIVDALCSDSCTGYEMYSILEKNDTPSNVIDNYLAGSPHLYRIEGQGIVVNTKGRYELNGVPGYFISPNETAEEVEFITM